MKDAKVSCLTGSLQKYLKELSSKTTAPGGGSAAAVVAALGAGLNLMVINYSIKKDSSHSIQSEFVVLKEKQTSSWKRLSELIDEDCRVFRELMDALASRSAQQDKYVAAASIPIEICRESAISLEVTALLMEDSNKNLLTDVGSAAHMLDAAFAAAALNVYVNLKYIKDKDFVFATVKELKQMEAIVRGTAKEISGRVKKALKADS